MRTIAMASLWLIAACQASPDGAPVSAASSP